MLGPEVEARVILPAARAMIAKKLMKEYRFTQAKVASLLGITQATVSNYCREKRGITKGLELNEIKDKVDEVADLLAKNPDPTMASKYLVSILRFAEEKKIVCDIHRKLEPWLKEDCNVCFI